jgi:hypothetical protein
VISLSEWRKRQEKLSRLTSKSTPRANLELLGQTLTKEHDLSEELTQDLNDLIATYSVLDRAHRDPFTVKSTFARNGAYHVALAASDGLISTLLYDEELSEIGVVQHCGLWRITEHGKEYLKGLQNVVQNLLEASETDPVN